ncbi:hypothetical protein BCR35DRAFT_351087 [Leucosporidium creatinivorum]|uniref:RRM domain-containing protein n=1 Tax=Leucosporidium creatinivorum TaxID=106004 RepID=A0A1Y2FW84_9BASI|nr:hypothetical protein BCR35DRAFT_351087 [Leucosporidium creatinivorum]
MKLDLGAGAASAGTAQTIAPWPGYRQQREVKLENIDRATNIYVRLLPPEATDSDLHALGSRFGQVLSVRALMATSKTTNPFSGLPVETQTCKGVGFILFKSPDEAERAVVSLNAEGFEASFAKESVSLKLRRLADESSTNLYLTNIPPFFGDHDIVQLLASATVLSVRILRENDSLPNAERGDGGKSKGIGFARLEDRETADEAIARLNGLQLPGAHLPLRVRYADTREQRKLKQEVGFPRRSRSSGLESGASTPSASGALDRFRFDSPSGSPSRGNIPLPSLFNTPTKFGNAYSSMQWTPTVSPASSMHASPFKPSVSVATPHAQPRQQPGYFDRPPPPSFIPQGFFRPSVDPFQTSHLAHYPAPSPPVGPSFAYFAEHEAAAFYHHLEPHPAPSPAPKGSTLKPFTPPDDTKSISTGAGGETGDSAPSASDSTFSFGCCGSAGGSGSVSAGPLKTRFFPTEEEEELELGNLGLGRLDRDASLGGEVKEGNGPGSEAWILRRLEARKSLP